jgi:hypothetical protein
LHRFTESSGWRCGRLSRWKNPGKPLGPFTPVYRHLAQWPVDLDGAKLG